MRLSLIHILMFVFVSNTVANLLMFVPMYMITLGGPEMSTNLMMYEAYKSGFIYADFGRSYADVYKRQTFRWGAASAI